MPFVQCNLGLVVRVSKVSSVLLTPCSLSLPPTLPTGRPPRRSPAASSSTMVSPSIHPPLPRPHAPTHRHHHTTQRRSPSAKKQGGKGAAGGADASRQGLTEEEIEGTSVGTEGRAMGSACRAFRDAWSAVVPSEMPRLGHLRALGMAVVPWTSVGLTCACSSPSLSLGHPLHIHSLTRPPERTPHHHPQRSARRSTCSTCRGAGQLTSES